MIDWEGLGSNFAVFELYNDIWVQKGDWTFKHNAMNDGAFLAAKTFERPKGLPAQVRHKDGTIICEWNCYAK